MNPDDWAQVKKVFARVVELPPDQIRSELERACQGNATIQRKVLELLAAHDEAGAFLEDPVVAPGTRVEVQLPRKGTLVSHYEITEHIGGGGMGIVYEARDQKLKRKVALKFLPPEWGRSPAAKRRFLREARAASSLDHQNICTVYEVDELGDGQLFIAMAHYEGATLKRRLAGGALPVDQALDACIQVAEGLSAAHAAGIVHRDIKPANVMLTTSGVVKILDFGLAMFSNETRLTRTGETIGTIAYMAPEQLRHGEIDQRVDLWSLGVVLHELLTGQLPFAGQHEQAIVYSILNDQPTRIDVSDRRLAASLNAILQRALSKQPARRYANAQEMAVDLRAARGRADSGSVTAELLPPKLRRSRRIALLVLAGVILVLLSVYVIRQAISPSQPRVESAQTSIPAAERSIAVLFFHNMTGDPALEWLRAGITELLTTDLAQSPQLSVTGPDRVYRVLQSFGELEKPAVSEGAVDRVAEALEVENVLFGSFFRGGDKIRVTAHIWDTPGGRRIASRSAEIAGIDDIFTLVDDLAAGVRADLGIAASGQGLDRELRFLTTSSAEAFRHYSNALLLRYNERIDESIPEYERAIELDPNFALALSKLSNLYALKGKDRQARELSRRAVANLEDLPERDRHYVEGNHFSWREETFGRAIDAYRRAIELYPDHWAAHHNLALTYMELELFPQALEHLLEVARGVPDRVSNYGSIAFCHFAMGDVLEGAGVLEEAVASYPHAVGAKLLLADYRTQSGDFSGAQEAFESAGLGGNTFEALDRRWRLLLAERNWNALEEWERASGSSANTPHYTFRKGILDLYRGDYASGIERLRESAANMSEPGRASSVARRLAAQALLAIGDYGGAIAEAELAMEDGVGDSGEWAGLYIKATARARSGQIEEARQLAETLRVRTALIPGAKEERRYFHLLGEIALAENNVAQAASHLSSAQRLLHPRGFNWAVPEPGEHVPVWFSTASALEARGDHQAASEYYELIASRTAAEGLFWPIETTLATARVADSGAER